MDNNTTYRLEYDYSELRGRIKAIFGTEGKFAEAIGRTGNFVSKVFNGLTYFQAIDIHNACEVLCIDVSDIGFYFYTPKVCKTKQ